MAVNNGGGLTKAEIEGLAVGVYGNVAQNEAKLELVVANPARSRLENFGHAVRYTGRLKVKAGQEVLAGEALCEARGGAKEQVLWLTTLNEAETVATAGSVNISAGGVWTVHFAIKEKGFVIFDGLTFSTT